MVAERGRGPGLEAEQDGVVAREACGHLSEKRRRAGTAVHPELRAGELRLRRLGEEGEKRLKDPPAQGH